MATPKDQNRDRDEPVAEVVEHLAAVVDAATAIHDDACRKLLVDAVNKLSRDAPKAGRREIVRYAEAGGDPLIAVRGNFPGSADPKQVARLVKYGWASPMSIGRKTYYRFLIGEPFSIEIGANVRAAQSRPGKR